MRRSDAAYFDAMAYLFASLRHALDLRTPTREDYESLISICKRLYRENTELRERLRELERLASSWTGTPERHPVIQRARAALGRR